MRFGSSLFASLLASAAVSLVSAQSNDSALTDFTTQHVVDVSAAASSSSSSASSSTFSSSSSATVSVMSMISSSSMSGHSPASNASGVSPDGSSSSTSSSSSSTMTPAPSSTTTTTSSSSSSTTTTTASSSTASTSTAGSSSTSTPLSTASTSPAASSSISATSISSGLPTTPYLPRNAPLADPTYIPIVAAIVSGFGLLLLLLILFISMAIIYRHLGRKDPMKSAMKKPKKGDANAFYSGMEPQSNQYLVSSMSTQSFASSPSDPRLGTPGIYYNRGFDTDLNPHSSSPGGGGQGSGPAAVAYDNDDGFKPIQIRADVAPPKQKSGSVSRA